MTATRLDILARLEHERPDCWHWPEILDCMDEAGLVVDIPDPAAVDRYDTALAVIRRFYDGWTILDGAWCLPCPAGTRLGLTGAEAAVLDELGETP